jgi:hypothetical protein
MERIVEDYKALEAKAKEEHEKAKSAEQAANVAKKDVEEKVIEKLEGETRSLKGIQVMLETKVQTREQEITSLRTDLKNSTALADQRLLETNQAKKDLNDERVKYADNIQKVSTELEKRRKEFKDGLKT